MGHTLNGSLIKGWFQYRCERKVRYESMSGLEQSAIPLAINDKENPWAVKGVDFEDGVVATLASRDRLLRTPGVKKASDPLRESVAIPFLRGEGNGRYATQLNLKPKSLPPFAASLADTNVGKSLPDLIQRTTENGALTFSIIDIKATRQATAFHKAQVAFYTLLLKARLKELNVAADVSPDGEIWCFPKEGPLDGSDWSVEAFKLRPYERQVEALCEQTLPSIFAHEVSKTSDQTFFHVYFKCEQCKFLPHCMTSVRPASPNATRDISAVAGMSHQAKKTLVQRGVRTVRDLASQTEAIAAQGDAGWKLSRTIGALINRAKAISDDKIGPGKEQQTYLMPARTDVALYLSADYDAIDGTLAALGYLYVDAEDERSRIEVVADSSGASETNALLAVFGEVVADLAAVDAHNENVESTGSGEPKQAHIFVYEPQESVYLQDAVKRHLSDARVRNGLLNMVRLFPPEEVIPEPEFRGIDHLPATALRTVIEQLVALPVTVSHDLAQVSQALERLGGAACAYRPAENFARPFSSMLAMDLIRNLREGRRDAVDVESIREDVSARLKASRGVAEWLFETHAKRIARGNQPLLRLRKKPFRLQASFDPLDVSDLDVLTALELLENRSAKLETLIRLSRPKKDRADTGRALGPLKFIREEDNGTTWILEAPDDFLDTDLAVDAFGLILSDGEPESVLEPSLWDAFRCSIKGIYGRKVYVRTPQPRARRPERLALERKMSMAGNADWWIDQAFKDVNTARVQDFIRNLSGKTS